MADELLLYYNEELSYIRQLAAEFAKDHPKIAGRLRISPDAIEDPHVARLIEAFAYLNARIRLKLDDDFPELTDAMLGVLYPHYLAPIPSMAIAQMRAAADLTAPYVLQAGVQVETAPIGGEPCRFRTCYPVTLWPVRVEAATLSGMALEAPSIPGVSEVASVLKVALGCVSEELTLSELQPKSLRFYLRGEGQHVFPLYQLLFNDLVQIVVFEPGTGVTRMLSPSTVAPVGFERDEGMLQYPPQAFIGYRLLSEFFAFPQKFLFLDLTGLADALVDVGNRVEFFFYFRRRLTGLEQKINANTFALGCTPLVNLYPKRAEPIPLDHQVTEYRVVPDARRPKAFEVYSVDNVVASNPDGGKACYAPFFGTSHGLAREEQRQFWKVARRPAPGSNPGTEVFLSVVDLDLNPSAQPKWVAHVETTCLNRDLPSHLKFGGGEPRLRLGEGAAAIEHVECLTAPTRTLRPPGGRGGMWRLVSHLTLNHLSITEKEQGAAALREILKLYDFKDSAETRAMIESIVKVDSRADIARIPGYGAGTPVRGLKVTIEFDEKRFAGSGVFLFAGVLERFLALYCTVNSFTRLVAKVQGREGALRKWQPRAGEKRLL